MLLGQPAVCHRSVLNAAERQFAIDAKLHRAARAKGYDAIVLMSTIGYRRFLTEGRVPLSIELNFVGRRLEVKKAEACSIQMITLTEMGAMAEAVTERKKLASGTAGERGGVT